MHSRCLPERKLTRQALGAELSQLGLLRQLGDQVNQLRLLQYLVNHLRHLGLLLQVLHELRELGLLLELLNELHELRLLLELVYELRQLRLLLELLNELHELRLLLELLDELRELGLLLELLDELRELGLLLELTELLKLLSLMELMSELRRVGLAKAIHLATAEGRLSEPLLSEPHGLTPRLLSKTRRGAEWLLLPEGLLLPEARMLSERVLLKSGYLRSELRRLRVREGCAEAGTPGHAGRAAQEAARDSRLGLRCETRQQRICGKELIAVHCEPPDSCRWVEVLRADVGFYADAVR